MRKRAFIPVFAASVLLEVTAGKLGTLRTAPRKPFVDKLAAAVRADLGIRKLVTYAAGMLESDYRKYERMYSQMETWGQEGTLL